MWMRTLRRDDQKGQKPFQVLLPRAPEDFCASNQPQAECSGEGDCVAVAQDVFMEECFSNVLCHQKL
jgi:hypothetical protein